MKKLPKRRPVTPLDPMRIRRNIAAIAIAVHEVRGPVGSEPLMVAVAVAPKGDTPTAE